MPESPPHSAARIKKALIDEGFEVFRSRGEEIVLAERPRENLIMDWGCAFAWENPSRFGLVLRAQRADYPNEDEPRLFERVRQLATLSLRGGFVEIATAVSPVADPSDATRTLDTFYEITYAKPAAAFDEVLGELRFALSLEKRA